MFRTAPRAFLGVIAGAISVLVFHQTTLQALFWLGLAPQAAFRIASVPPFNAPMVLSVTFWGAVYGAVFALLQPRFNGPIWVHGIAAGLFAALLAWFVVRPLSGNAIAFGWQADALLRSLAAHEMWGLGVALRLPLLRPRHIGRTQRSWPDQRLAA